VAAQMIYCCALLKFTVMGASVVYVTLAWGMVLARSLFQR